MYTEIIAKGSYKTSKAITNSETVVLAASLVAFSWHYFVLAVCDDELSPKLNIFLKACNETYLGKLGIINFIILFYGIVLDIYNTHLFSH